jgi:hypothetical protein
MSCPYAPRNGKKSCPLYRRDSSTYGGHLGHDYCGTFREPEGGA